MMSDNTIILIRILGGRVILAENRQPLFRITLLGSRIMQKVAAITAGGSGMGAVAARRLAADGFLVAILSSSGKGQAPG